MYVDNETPNRFRVAAEMVVQQTGLVVVGLYPDENPWRIVPGAICALEWYPYHGYNILPVPKAPAYILQWRFANDGDTPPTRTQGLRLMARAMRHRPRLLWLY